MVWFLSWRSFSFEKHKEKVVAVRGDPFKQVSEQPQLEELETDLICNKMELPAIYDVTIVDYFI